MHTIILWDEWSKAFSHLRSAFSRQTTFWWAAVFCAGLTIRSNHRGVSSIVECLSLKETAYQSLVRLCQSGAIDLDELIKAWIRLALKIFQPLHVNDYIVLFGDGIKVGKEGKRMPSVKLMHQNSQNNKKAEFIMGHYFQALSLGVQTSSSSVVTIPLVARVHDGIVLSNRSKKTVLHRFGDLVREVVQASNTPAIVVADAYYANASTMNEIKKAKCHLVTRVAHNTVAYQPAKAPKEKRRGRPAVKGERVALASLYDSLDQ